MREEQHIYFAIDLKSFYASVECIERNLDPLTTNLVVADELRTQKTICLAVSPPLKASCGISGRARLFEAIEKVKEANTERRLKISNRKFVGVSYNDTELKQNPDLEIGFIIAPPQMKKYMDYSTKIYNIYLKYFSSDDIYSYSIDEVFCDATRYLKTYKMTARELVTKIVQDVYKTTGITATAGIGTNLYLCKIAMDIVAKHEKADKYGVRIAELDETSYRRLLWSHRPLRDFWRVGKGYSDKLEKYGIYTMGDVARTSINNEKLLYNLFGINAELLIDHAWGYEPCTLKEVKNYVPKANSISSGQVLHCPYNYEKTKLIVKEMTDNLTLDLVEKRLVTNQIVLDIGYDIDNLTDPNIRNCYKGKITKDRYGREIPEHAHGTINLKDKTSSTKKIMDSVMELYDRIINKNLLTRRITITANKVENEDSVKEDNIEQIDLFTDYKEKQKEIEKEQREKEMQKAIINIKNKFGKNAIIKGMNLEEGGTTIERNSQVGGHKG